MPKDSLKTRLEIAKKKYLNKNSEKNAQSSSKLGLAFKMELKMEASGWPLL